MNETEIRQMIRAEVRALIEPLRDAVADLAAERRPGKVLTTETEQESLDELRRRDWERAGLSGRTIDQIEQEAPTVLTVDDDPDETALAAEEYAGVPLAAGFEPRSRPALTQGLASGFDTFSRETSGTLVDPARELGDIVTAALRRKEPLDEDGKPFDPRFMAQGF